jgi:hypothetical protein
MLQDGIPALNLASFVSTYQEEEAEELMRDSESTLCWTVNIGSPGFACLCHRRCTEHDNKRTTTTESLFLFLLDLNKNFIGQYLHFCKPLRCHYCPENRDVRPSSYI